MSLINRRSRGQQLLASVGDALAGASAIRSVLPGSGHSGKRPSVHLPTVKELTGGVPKDLAAKAGLVLGGLTVLTAGSSRISILRRRDERRESNS